MARSSTTSHKLTKQITPKVTEWMFDEIELAAGKMDISFNSSSRLALAIGLKHLRQIEWRVPEAVIAMATSQKDTPRKAQPGSTPKARHIAR